MKTLDALDGQTPVVVELSSWHLELLPQSQKSPRIAIITNLYPDHLNRYKSITEYALAKTNIFKHQTKNDFLILNKKNDWTKFFLKQKPRSKILYSNTSFIKHSVFDKKFVDQLGKHNLQNLKTAALAAHIAGVGWDLINKTLPTLPQIKFREEVVYRHGQLTVVNDTTATSPDATIAALNRFGHQGQTLILITGGTDKNLNYQDWAKAVKKNIAEENLFLLDGSATTKMLAELTKIKYFKKEPRLFRRLDEMLRQALKNATISKQKTTVLFSPAAASFEKFKNEFDRGKQFNKLLKKEVA